MKKFLSILLILVLMCSMLPAASVSAKERGAESLPASELPLAPNISPEEIGWLDMDPAKETAWTKRGNEQEDNLVFPGPHGEQSAYLRLMDSTIYLGAFLTGKKNQYYCMMVYEGTDLSGEPVAADWGDFVGGKGYDTVLLTLDMGLKPGQYSLVTFTGEVEENYIVPVENTASMTQIYVYDNQVPTPQEFYIAEFETGERVDTIQIPLGYTSVFEIRRNPLPSGIFYPVLFNSVDSFEDRSDGLEVRDAGGFLFLTPQKSGTVVYRLKCGEFTREYTIEICYYADGHHYGEPIPAGTATGDTQGCTLYYCSGCGHVKKEFSPSYDETFEGFQDVPADSWYAQSVRECVKENLFQGVSTTAFAPDRSMTRAMLVTVLWRYEGQPTGTDAGFSDVPHGAWYTEAVNWAAQEGIVNGVGKGKFNPNGTITREQLTTILYRYAEGKALDTDISADPSTYPDGGQISSWAEDGFSWALGYELISGVKSGNTVTLRPQGHATRAQVSTILLRLMDKAKKEAIVRPDPSGTLYSGEVQTQEGVDLTWTIGEDGLLQIGGIVPESWKPDQWKLPWYPYREQITAVEFLPGIEYVWIAAFSSYPNLQRVKLAPTVKAVEDSAFYKCIMLKEVQLSEGLQAIDRAAFQSCSALESVDLPDSLLHIGTSAFAGCLVLQNPTFPENLKTIGDSAFKLCRKLMEVTLPNSVQEMGKGVFADCSALQKVVLPMGLSQLKGETFMKCSSLTDVTLPLALESMKGGEFYACSSLTELSFFTMFEKMYTGAFTACTSLKTLYFFGYSLNIFYLNDTDLPYYSSRAFGPDEGVVVYGIPGSEVESISKNEPCVFKDITEILT